MSCRERNQCGFTLVEVVIVSLLFMILGGALLVVFLTGQASYLSADANVQVQQEARKAFDNVTRELREAGPVTGPIVSANPGPGLGQQLAYQIAQGYNVPGQCDLPTPTICWGDGTTLTNWVHLAVTRNVEGAQLVRCTTASSAVVNNFAGCRVLANNVRGDTSSFVYDGPTRVVTVNLEFLVRVAGMPGGPGGTQAGGTRTTNVLSARVRLRNS